MTDTKQDGRRGRRWTSQDKEEKQMRRTLDRTAMISSVERERAKISLSPILDEWLRKEVP